MNSVAANNSKCLLLNADHSPLKIISWQRAIVWAMKYEDNQEYGIEIIEYYKDKFIQGASNKRYPVPCIAKTIKYFNFYNRKVNFSRYNLFIRDNFTCQYCGTKLSQSQLTYDHIVPKCRFINNRKFSTNWTNIVTACRPCNHKKGNKTPNEAGMSLIKPAIEPQYALKYLPWYQQATTISESCLSKEWESFIKKCPNYV
jgi:5-methylcytosine-specific restriction endonuclease McrA